MTASQTRTLLRQVGIGLATLLIGAFLIGAVSGVKEHLAGTAQMRVDFDQHTIRQEAEMREQMQMIGDILCSPNVNPTNQRCKR